MSDEVTTKATGKTKVFWTEDEKRLLCEEAARLMHGVYCTRKLDALHKAQEKVLPEHRRRTLLALTSVTWFTEGLSRELERLRCAGVSPLSGKVESAVHATPSPTLDDVTLEVLWTALRPRLVSELARFVSDVLQEVRWPQTQGEPDSSSCPKAQSLIQALLGQAARPGAATEDLAEGSRKPTVLIVGLKGGQMEEVRRDFARCLDLRFFGVDENKDKLKSMCESVDHAIALTGFISHTHEDIMCRRTKDYIRCGGGITRLKDTLGQIARKAVPVTA